MLFELNMIKTVRMKLGISQKQLAKECQISASMLNQIETKKAKPSYDTAKKIFEFLEKSQYKNQKKASEIYTTPLIKLVTSDTIDSAIQLMIKHEISQIPVFRGTKCVGQVTDEGLATRGSPDSIDKSVKLGKILEATPPIVPTDYPAFPLKHLILVSKCVLVSEEGEIIGIITAQNLLELI